MLICLKVNEKSSQFLEGGGNEIKKFLNQLFIIEFIKEKVNNSLNVSICVINKNTVSLQPVKNYKVAMKFCFNWLQLLMSLLQPQGAVGNIEGAVGNYLTIG